MRKIGILKNTIQEYAWGSYDAIPALLGLKTPSEKPQAELWMGAHPKAPSLVKVEEQWVSLLELIENNPVDILGKKIADRFNKKLPYLFKVLAAAKPLSIQAHPNRIQARSGYQRENDLGIPIDAFQRNYRDDHHKPECICALTPFWVLSGFRKISDILFDFKTLSPMGLESEIHDLEKSNSSQGLKRFFKALIDLPPDRKRTIIQNVLSLAEEKTSDDPVYRWIMTLNEEFPNDIGIFSPILLNLICLKPGQAMFLPPGDLHAYLEGTSIELMANSDNVLRGGLTSKNIDVNELLEILNFSERQIDILEPRQIRDGEYRYHTDADEFCLSVLLLKKDKVFYSETDRSVEMLLCTQGQATISDFDLDEHIVIEKGVSVIIPAAVKAYAIEGNAEFYKAAVPTE